MEKRRNLTDAARDQLAEKAGPAPRAVATGPGPGGKAFRAVVYMGIGLAAGVLLGRLLPMRFWR